MKRRPSASWYVVIACVAFVICTYISDLMRLAGLRRILHGWIWVAAVNVSQFIICVSAIMAAHAVKLKGALRELGLRAPIDLPSRFPSSLHLRCSSYLPSPLRLTPRCRC